MAQPSIEVEGIRELVRELKQFEDGTKDLKALHTRAAALVKKGARPPRRSGRLAATLRSSGQARTGIVRAGRASVPYAAVIHWGWKKRGIRANPYLSDSLEKNEAKVFNLYREGLADLVKKHNLN